MRPDNRQSDQLRPLKIKRHFSGAAPGSVLVQAGKTSVLCAASVEAGVPAWLAGQGRGWLTAEYSMLPGSTSPRKRRDRGSADGRATEIQRLIGRSLRAVTDLAALGERTVTIDCDVLEADGGTRTLSVTGGFIALVDALRSIVAELPTAKRLPIFESVAAVSVGMVGGQAILDLDYQEDFAAAVDMNVVMTGSGRFIEVQGSGEEATFSEEELHAMLALARAGIVELTASQRVAMGHSWPSLEKR
ncbi:MAG: ribonuclease PH [Thermoguttaceae bacterium]